VSTCPRAANCYRSPPIRRWPEPRRVGDSLISDTRLALEQLVGLINDRGTGSAPAAPAAKIEIVDAESSPLTPDAVWSTLATVSPPTPR